MKIARRITALSFLLVLIFGAPWFVGSYNATELFGWIPFADPLAAMEIYLASNLFNPSLVIGALMLIAICLVLGPVFCGWLCPLGLVFDLCTRKKTRAPARIARYLVFGFALGFSLAFGIPLFQSLSPINFMSWLFVYAHALQAAWIMLVFLSVIVVLDLFFPRLWCRVLCPLGGLYAMVGQKAPFGVMGDQKVSCQKNCVACQQACPMGIQKEQMECIRCGACVDACPQERLHLGF